MWTLRGGCSQLKAAAGEASFQAKAFIIKGSFFVFVLFFRMGN